MNSVTGTYIKSLIIAAEIVNTLLLHANVFKNFIRSNHNLCVRRGQKLHLQNGLGGKSAIRLLNSKRHIDKTLAITRITADYTIP